MNYPQEFKENAVRMLLNEKRDANTLSQLLGVPVRTLLDWQREIRIHQNDLYQTMLTDSRTEQSERQLLFTQPITPTEQRLADAEQRLRQLGNINRHLKLCVLDLRAALVSQLTNKSVYDAKRLMVCWETLPKLWRLAAAAHAGLYTIEELTQMEPQIQAEEIHRAVQQLGAQPISISQGVPNG